MMHEAWSSIEEVPCCFSRSSVKFQGHTALKIFEFDPKWAFPDCNSSLNSPMTTKWYAKLEAAWKRCPIVFQCHLSNFKVAWLKKIVNFYPDWAFPDCISSLSSQWLRNDAKSLKYHRRGALLFFGVIHQISRSHGLKNGRFESNLSKITRPVAVIKSLRFALFNCQCLNKLEIAMVCTWIVKRSTILVYCVLYVYAHSTCLNISPKVQLDYFEGIGHKTVQWSKFGILGWG